MRLGADNREDREEGGGWNKELGEKMKKEGEYGSLSIVAKGKGGAKRNC